MAERTCPHCGSKYRQVGRGRPRGWCFECLPPFGTIPDNEYRKRSAELGVFKQTAKHGRCCGVYKRSPQPGKQRRYIDIECAWCFSTFQGKAGKTRFCCDSCSKRHRAHWLLYGDLDYCPLPICTLCRNTYSAPPNRPSTLCQECQGARTERRRGVGQARNQALRRHIIKQGDPTLTLDALIERDSNTCWICQGSCGPRNDPRTRPTIDHLQPVSQGGTHDWHNVALAHARCNTLRGAPTSTS